VDPSRDRCAMPEYDDGGDKAAATGNLGDVVESGNRFARPRGRERCLRLDGQQSSLRHSSAPCHSRYPQGVRSASVSKKTRDELLSSQDGC
jgi:hypothetical protein